MPLPVSAAQRMWRPRVMGEWYSTARLWAERLREQLECAQRTGLRPRSTAKLPLDERFPQRWGLMLARAQWRNSPGERADASSLAKQVAQPSNPAFGVRAGSTPVVGLRSTTVGRTNTGRRGLRCPLCRCSCRLCRARRMRTTGRGSSGPRTVRSPRGARSNRGTSDNNRSCSAEP